MAVHLVRCAHAPLAILCTHDKLHRILSVLNDFTNGHYIVSDTLAEFYYCCVPWWCMSSAHCAVTEIPYSKHRQKVTTGDIFIHRETNEVVCSICSEANALSEFTSGKKRNDWKLDYLKPHLKPKVHVYSIIKSQN
jgi:hypothetical protein